MSCVTFLAGESGPHGPSGWHETCPYIGRHAVGYMRIVISEIINPNHSVGRVGVELFLLGGILLLFFGFLLVLLAELVFGAWLAEAHFLAFVAPFMV